MLFNDTCNLQIATLLFIWRRYFRNIALTLLKNCLGFAAIEIHVTHLMDISSMLLSAQTIMVVWSKQVSQLVSALDPVMCDPRAFPGMQTTFRTHWDNDKTEKNMSHCSGIIIRGAWSVWWKSGIFESEFNMELEVQKEDIWSIKQVFRKTVHEW